MIVRIALLTITAQFRITMAAIDPTEAPQADENGNIPNIPRATLKIVRPRFPDMMDELDDPSKSKKAKREAALKKLIEAAQDEEDSDEEMTEGAAKPNGTTKKADKKGKEPATSSDEDEDSEDDEAMDWQELVVCTLDTERVRIPAYLTAPAAVVIRLVVLTHLPSIELPAAPRHHHCP